MCGVQGKGGINKDDRVSGKMYCVCVCVVLIEKACADKCPWLSVIKYHESEVQFLFSY